MATKNETILVVEDDAQISNFIAYALKNVKVKVCFSFNL